MENFISDQQYKEKMVDHISCKYIHKQGIWKHYWRSTDSDSEGRDQIQRRMVQICQKKDFIYRHDDESWYLFDFVSKCLLTLLTIIS